MEEIETYTKQLPFRDRLNNEEQDSISRQAVIRRFSKDEVINSSNTSCLGMILILSGSIRVSILSEDGREITIYRINEGECCVTTASCVISQITFDTYVTAEEDTQMLVVPSFLFGKLMEANVYVRAYAYELETKRFSQAMWVLQQILFKRFDQRLSGYLLDLHEKYGTDDIKETQEEIARNVNSAREVVARMLKRFSDEGLVELKRGHIILKDIEGLKKIK